MSNFVVMYGSQKYTKPMTKEEAENKLNELAAMYDRSKLYVIRTDEPIPVEPIKQTAEVIDVSVVCTTCSL